MFPTFTSEFNFKELLAEILDKTVAKTVANLVIKIVAKSKHHGAFILVGFFFIIYYYIANRYSPKPDIIEPPPLQKIIPIEKDYSVSIPSKTPIVTADVDWSDSIWADSKTMSKKKPFWISQIGKVSLRNLGDVEVEFFQMHINLIDSEGRDLLQERSVLLPKRIKLSAKKDERLIIEFPSHIIDAANQHWMSKNRTATVEKMHVFLIGRTADGASVSVNVETGESNVNSASPMRPVYP